MSALRDLRALPAAPESTSFLDDIASADTQADASADTQADAFVRAVASAPAVDPGTGVRAQGPALSGAVLGRYQVLCCLGQGGMGIVYAAFDLVLCREVALKLLPAHLTRDPERRRLFLREARSAAAVRSPHVVTVYDAGEEGDCVFIAMERVVGRTLRSRLELAARDPRPSAKLDVREVVRLGVSIARGVAAAHDAGVIHSDLKPDNIMIGDDGELKIVDFGLARLRSSASAPGAPGAPAPSAADIVAEHGRIAGTPGYMSPEQLRGDPMDERSDVFSLGVVLFELATGYRPSPDAFAAYPPEAGVRVGLETPRARRPPPSLEKILARCLAPRPADRYPSCRAVAADLAEVEAALSASSSRTPARVAACTAAALTAVALVAGVAGVAGGRLGDPVAPHWRALAARVFDGPRIPDAAASGPDLPSFGVTSPFTP